MSWKSIVITGLLCVAASPVLAVPALSIDVSRFTSGANNGRMQLDASGNIVWVVKVDPDDANVGTGNGSVATEVAFTLTGGNLVSATKNATNWDRDNPGVAPASFAFWTAASEGLVTDGNNAFAALGSINFTSGDLQDFLTITQQGPLYIAAGNPSNRTTFSLNAFGSYGGNGRLAQAGANSDTVNSLVTKTVLPGDTNFNGDVDLVDLATLGANYNTLGTKNWAGGNFNGTGAGLTNLAILGAFYNAPPITAPGGGAVAGAAVPEPISAVLLVAGLLGLAAVRKRK